MDNGRVYFTHHTHYVFIQNLKKKKSLWYSNDRESLGGPSQVDIPIAYEQQA